MSFTQLPETIAETESLGEEVTFPPSDLWSDESPLKSDWYLDQIELLLACWNCDWLQGVDLDGVS